jgi:hypothetical protein
MPAAFALPYATFTRRSNAFPPARRWFILQTGTVLLVVVAAISIWGNRLTNEFMQIPWGLKSALLDTPIVPPGKQAEYAAMQRTIPTDQATLATVGYSFLLDFRSHNISIADYPGAASLPPGWPSRQTSEALANYLLAHHLRYLVYNYAYFAGFYQESSHVITDASRTQWIHSQAKIALGSHQQYAELARTRRRLYDDGNMYVLDLATPATSPDSASNSVNFPKQPLTGPQRPQ